MGTGKGLFIISRKGIKIETKDQSNSNIIYKLKKSNYEN